MMLSLILSSCMWRNDFGITAKTYNGFTKDDAEKYNYILEEDNITWKDKNGNDVLLTQEDKSTIATKVNQCLMDAGYRKNENKTKTIALNLDFTETETKDAEIYYDEEMVNKYQGKYNFDFEPYIGPKNKTFTILDESFINYSGGDKVYFIGLPNYSKFGGINDPFGQDKYLDVSCQKSYGRYCLYGTTDLSNIYVKLSGKEKHIAKFDVKLHYKQNLLKDEKDIIKTRQWITKYFVQYVCLFIGDNFDDLQIVTPEKYRDDTIFHQMFGSNMQNNSFREYAKYQYLKNLLNNYEHNTYTIMDKATNKTFENISAHLQCVLPWESHWTNHDLYGEELHRVSFYFGSKRHLRWMYFHQLKYPISQLEIKNNYHK